MSIDRRTKLLQRSNALSAAGNQKLPQPVRDKYQKAADHLDLSLNLEDALNQKGQRQAAQQLPRNQPQPSQDQSQPPLPVPQSQQQSSPPAQGPNLLV